MTLVNKDSVVSDTLSLESTELERHVGRVLEDHITSGGNTSDVLKVLAHQTIATAGICRVTHIELAISSCCVTRLLAKKVVLLRLVLVQVL